jgi:basic membrane lipoprotein Med (substrate-binding protein (PBP1-ABC) superfamily)
MSQNQYDLSVYENARRAALKEYRRASFGGHYPYLPTLDSICTMDKPKNETAVGTQEIPLELIVGTKQAERASAFAANFMPLLDSDTEFAIKWMRLYAAHMEEGISDPVEVCEYRRRFYVKEGNKRVSVLKYVQGAAISAQIIRILPELTDSEEDRLYEEFLSFFRVCPVYDFEFTKPGDYQRFAEALGLDLVHPWTQEQIRSVKAAKAHLASALTAIGQGGEMADVCEAMLVYLQIYSLDSLMNLTSAQIQQRLMLIQREIRTWKRDDNIRRVDSLEGTQETVPFRMPLFFTTRKPLWTEENPLRAAFLYDKRPEVSSWIYAHEFGRKHVEDVFCGLVRTKRYDDCGTDEALEAAIDRAAGQEECDVLFTISPVMMKESLRGAIRYPKVRFLNCSINLTHNAVRTYYSRMYEAKFLMGALSALSSVHGRIGYRADYPIYGTIASINAFAIGAALINPYAKIYLSWATEKQTNWREELREAGVDVISGPDSIRPEEPSREYGIYRVTGSGVQENLAAPVWNWGTYYERILRTILNGTYDARELTRDDQAVNYYLGMEDDVIDVVLSEKLPYYSRKMIHMLRDGMREGRLNLFGGELRSQDAVVQTEGSPALSMSEIIRMNWLNDNVIGHVPSPEQLSIRAQNVTAVSGVAPAGETQSADVAAGRSADREDGGEQV